MHKRNTLFELHVFVFKDMGSNHWSVFLNLSILLRVFHVFVKFLFMIFVCIFNVHMIGVSCIVNMPLQLSNLLLLL